MGGRRKGDGWYRVFGCGGFSLGFQEPQHFVVSWLQLQPRCFASQAVNACLLWMRLLGFCLRGSSFCLGASVFKPGLLFQISRIRFEQKQLPTISMPLVAWARDAESLEQIPSFHGVPAIRQPTHSHAVGEEGPTPPSQTALCPGQPYALVTLYAVLPRLLAPDLPSN